MCICNREERHWCLSFSLIRWCLSFLLVRQGLQKLARGVSSLNLGPTHPQHPSSRGVFFMVLGACLFINPIGASELTRAYRVQTWGPTHPHSRGLPIFRSGSAPARSIPLPLEQFYLIIRPESIYAPFRKRLPGLTGGLEA